VPQPKSGRVLAPRLNPPHAQKTMQSGLKSPDGLLENSAAITIKLSRINRTSVMCEHLVDRFPANPGLGGHPLLRCPLL